MMPRGKIAGSIEIAIDGLSRDNANFAEQLSNFGKRIEKLINSKREIAIDWTATVKSTDGIAKSFLTINLPEAEIDEKTTALIHEETVKLSQFLNQECQIENVGLWIKDSQGQNEIKQILGLDLRPMTKIGAYPMN